MALIRKGHRVAMDLAVALEVATLHLAQARPGEQMDRAVSFNRRLWQSVRRLASVAADVEEREAMLITAAQAERGLTDGASREIHAPGLIDSNRRLASLLAGRFSSTGALRELLEAWNRERAAASAAGFEAWLLDRLDGYAGPVSVS